MSRSNPTDASQHPCTRWVDWNGEHGKLTYYDKATKQDVDMGNKLTFILLDQLATIKGWHDASESNIHSNEVKDTRKEPFVVKAWKSNGILAEGFYSSIKDRVAAIGGKFNTNLYVAFRNAENEMQIGSIMLKGAALREWMEFSKEHRADIYKKAVVINGSKEGKKGSIKYHTPVFSVKDITPETDEQATELDRQLQSYLAAYLARPTEEKVDSKDPVHPADYEASAFTPETEPFDEAPF